MKQAPKSSKSKQTCVLNLLVLFPKKKQNGKDMTRCCSVAQEKGLT